ncbi:MAG: helix-turn-helix domain-containing protein [Steroidobacteraceae bacterium]
MISGSIAKEARLRAGFTQADLGARLGKPQSVIARWESGAVQPSLESLRELVRTCGLDLGFHLSKLDDSNTTLIDQLLRMSPAERFSDLISRVRFHEQLEDRRTRSG